MRHRGLLRQRRGYWGRGLLAAQRWRTAWPAASTMAAAMDGFEPVSLAQEAHLAGEVSSLNLTTGQRERFLARRRRRAGSCARPRR